MRPRFMNRGSVAAVDASSQVVRGFNEAPIHESGKSPGSPSVIVLPSGFNEAPIHESGKSRRRGGNLPWAQASMRPRFMNRGSDHGGGYRGSGVRASMRPRFMNRGSVSVRIEGASSPCRFNEAPIHESGKCVPGLESAALFGASMRPRFMNRGSCLNRAGKRLAPRASMRPRFMNRGSILPSCH